MPTTETEYEVFIRIVAKGVEYIIPCSSKKVAQSLASDIVDMWYRNRRGR